MEVRLGSDILMRPKCEVEIFAVSYLDAKLYTAFNKTLHVLLYNVHHRTIFLKRSSFKLLVKLFKNI